MAMEILFGWGDFGERFAGGREEENGIVTEAALATRGRQDFAFDGGGEDGDHAATPGQRENADEARAGAPRVARLHWGQQLGDAIGRGGVRAGVAGRIDAGLASESVDDEA